MKGVRGLLVALTAILGGTYSAAAESVALVVERIGQVRVVGPTEVEGARPVGPFEWLAAGVRVDVPESASATVALTNGRLYRIEPGTRVVVRPESLETLDGRCRELARLPTLPRLAQVSAGARPGTRAGALRIRGRRIHDLYPGGEASALADAATLTFAPLGGIDQYAVEVEDEQGEVVFHARVRAGSVAVPPGVLRPGGRYRWQVRGASAEGPARGEAEFSVLDEAAAQARRALWASQSGAESAAALGLLAAVDDSLGLLREARESWSRALERSPGDADLAAAVGRIDALLHPTRPEQ
jgi:hypothetical protein